MAEINLLKSELQEKGLKVGSTQAGRWAFYIFLGILILELLAYGFLFWGEGRVGEKILDIDRRLANVDFEIGKIEKDRLEVVSFQFRLQSLQEILDNHVFWSKALGELEKYTYKPAIFTGLQVKRSEHKFILSGTIPSYTDLGKLILGLRSSSDILDVALQSSGQEGGTESGYNFNLVVTFDPKLLLK